MKLWIKVLLGLFGALAIVVAWVVISDKEFTETSNAAYIKSSAALFEQVGITPQSKFVQADGPVKRIHYYEMGEGEPLVLIHGGGGYASQWFTILQQLANSYHLFVVDRPGSGLTDNFNYAGVDLTSHGAEFVRSFMDAVNLDSAHMVGHSMGGLFSVNFADLYPQRVKNLVLIGHPAGSNTDIPPPVMMMGLPGANKILLKLIGEPTVAGSKDFHGMMLVHQPQQLSDLYWYNDLNAQLIPGNARTFNSLLENCVGLGGFKEEFLIQDTLFNLPHKVTFIVGDKDPWDTMENAEYLVSNMNNASLKIIKNASHLPWLDAPEESAKLILNAL
ncbi:alpha/beta hydrolase [uncultured Paraglaciecola sp.]|uniref:alpha/beta fold hydrolase n=1 Tax=uncultured Paraglaciecola sp. TaxID=1765024 RepID=UPI0030DA2B2C|tara:strand:- start:53193 stop:54188 length:996 start_codon:yes stop_codon:yes gene_type:complete